MGTFVLCLLAGLAGLACAQFLSVYITSDCLGTPMVQSTGACLSFAEHFVSNAVTSIGATCEGSEARVAVYGSPAYDCDTEPLILLVASTGACTPVGPPGVGLHLVVNCTQTDLRTPYWGEKWHDSSHSSASSASAATQGKPAGGNWPLILEEASVSSPVVDADGAIYYGTAAGKIHAFQGDTGAPYRTDLWWRYYADGRVMELIINPTSQVLYFLLAGDVYAALTATTETLWSKTYFTNADNGCVSQEPMLVLGPESSLADQKLYVWNCNEPGVMVVLSSLNGSLVWNGTGYGSAVVSSNGLLYAPFYPGGRIPGALPSYLYALNTSDLDDGPVWVGNLSATLPSSSPVLHGPTGLVFVVVGNYVTAFDGLTGEIVWGFDCQSWIASNVAIGGDKGEVVVFGTVDGVVFALSSSSGAVVWTVSLLSVGSYCQTPLIISIGGGMVYVTGNNTEMFAFTLAEGANAVKFPIVGDRVTSASPPIIGLHKRLFLLVQTERASFELWSFVDPPAPRSRAAATAVIVCSAVGGVAVMAGVVWWSCRKNKQGLNPEMKPLLEWNDPRFSTAASSKDFKFLERLGHGCSSAVLLANCTSAVHPFPTPPNLEYPYAVKVLYNFDKITTQCRRGRKEYMEEFQLLAKLPSHPGIVRFFCRFDDEVPQHVLRMFPPDVIQNMSVDAYGIRVPDDRIRTTFAVFEAHAPVQHWQNGPRVLKYDQFEQWAQQLLDALRFLEAHGVQHRDLKLDNIVVKEDGSLCIIDFGEAVRFPDPKPEKLRKVVCKGDAVIQFGNFVHAAPEVLNALTILDGGAQSVEVDFSGQAVFEVGVLLFEIAVLQHPVKDYCLPSVHEHYTREACCRLSQEMMGEMAAAGYPVSFVPLIRDMVARNPTQRPTLLEAARRLLPQAGVFQVDVGAVRK